MWSIKRDWDAKWDALRDVQFYKLPVEDVRMDAYEVRQQLKDCPKDAKEWPLYEVLTAELARFIELCPLIDALQHEAMRPRHCKDLCLEVKDDFNLKRIYSLNLL
jgi:hypothetical protein